MAIHSDKLMKTYPLRVRYTLIGVLGAVVLIFYAFPRFLGDRARGSSFIDEVVETFDIPPTQQFETPPPPSRPSIPVESEDEDLAEDITIDETDLDDFDWEAPPPAPDEGPNIRFIPFDEAPVPAGGYAALQKRVRYPEIAQEAGIEGIVIIHAYIDINGRVTETIVIKGKPNTGLDEAAMDAIRRTRFKPAKQRDRPVGVWIAIPINFRLAN